MVPVQTLPLVCTIFPCLYTPGNASRTARTYQSRNTSCFLTNSESEKRLLLPSVTMAMNV